MVYSAIKTLYSFCRAMRGSIAFKGRKISGCDSVIILGNGPSLLDFISKYSFQLLYRDVMAVNKFVCYEYYEIIKPAYYILADPIYFFKEEDGLSEDAKSEAFDVIHGIIDKTNWPMQVFFPGGARGNRSLKAKLEKNANISVHYINSIGYEGLDFVRYYLIDNRITGFCFQNVLIMGISLAIFLDYKKVFLIGADHSWLEGIKINEKNELGVVQKHFYERENTNIEKIGNGGVGNTAWHLDDYLFALATTFKEYRVIEGYARNREIDIFNATPKSYIDAFRRVGYEAVFEIENVYDREERIE